MRDIVFLTFLVISALYYYYSSNRILRSKNSPSIIHDIFANEKDKYRISVIIPARNEEENLSKLLPLLQNQTVKPYEIIVVDDNSSDGTFTIASRYEEVKVIRLSKEPPVGWTGKTWAVWNGFLKSSGDYLLFIDADVEPSNNFIETLLEKHLEHGGLISVWPYQRFEKFYEHLSFILNLMAVYSSDNFGFPSKKPSGAFGPVIFTTRRDYEKTGGHKLVSNAVVEDIKLGNLYLQHGLKVTNFLGNGIVKFRMYPKGLKQLLEGYSKSIAVATSNVSTTSLVLSFLWLAGIYSSIPVVLVPNNLFRYFVTAIILFVMAKSTGDYKWYDALLYPIHLYFFIATLLYSMYLKIVKKQVQWKGRTVDAK